MKTTELRTIMTVLAAAAGLMLGACNFGEQASSVTAPDASPAVAADLTFLHPYHVVKDFTITNALTFETVVTVQPNQVLEASAIAKETSVDPVMMAFFTGNTTADQYNATFVAVNDDFNGGLNPYIKWANNTGIARQVKIVCYAYNSYFHGHASVTVWLGGNQVQSSPNALVGGTIFRDNLQATLPPCAPTHSRFQVFQPYQDTTVLVALNAATLTGTAIIKSNSPDFDNSNSSIVAGTTFIPNHAPNAVLIYRPFDGGVWGPGQVHFIQEDYFPCASVFQPFPNPSN